MRSSRIRSRTGSLPRTAAVLAVAAGTLAGCGGAALGGGSDDADSGKVKVGLMVAKSGVYSSVGRDMERGFRLLLDEHGGKLGGKQVDLVDVDEGETPQSGVAAATRLVQQEQVDVTTGIVSGSTAVATTDLFKNNKVPLVVGNSGAVALSGSKADEYIWRASYVNPQPGEVLAKHLKKKLAKDEKVYLIAPDYTGGRETISGFKKYFPADRIAGESYTPFGTTSDYQPYLSKIRSSGAKAVFCFYAGKEAIDFTKQYAQFGLPKSSQLYSTGFLTEGSALTAEGTAAKGVKTVLHYSDDLDNPVNNRFVDRYTKKYGTAPTVYAAVMYDAGLVLDKAVGKVDGTVDGPAIKDALAKVGTIDGTRGAWRFNAKRDPVQTFYLRTVKPGSDGTLHNTIVKPIGTVT